MNKLSRILIVMMILISSVSIADASNEISVNGDTVTVYKSPSIIDWLRSAILSISYSAGTISTTNPGFTNPSYPALRVFIYEHPRLSTGQQIQIYGGIPINAPYSFQVSGLTEGKSYRATLTDAIDAPIWYVDFTYHAPSTPSPTPTPITTKPKPVIIPPVLSRFFDSIWSSIMGLFGLSIVGGQSIITTVNQPYVTTISLAFSPPDTVYSDGTYQAKFGEWFITDSNKNILKESGWSPELTTAPYVVTASFTPTSTAKYYLIGVVINQQYTWDGTKWNVAETVETKEVQEIISVIPSVEKKSPTSTAAGLLAGFATWLKGLFSWLPW